MAEEIKIIKTKEFVEELGAASSDCWLKDQDKKTYGITLDRVIEIAFKHLIETEGGWKYSDPIELLTSKLNRKNKNDAYEPKFSVEKVRDIYINAPGGWVKALNQHERDAVNLISEFATEEGSLKRAEGVYRAIAKWLDPCLKRGAYDLKEYEKQKAGGKKK